VTIYDFHGAPKLIAQGLRVGVDRCLAGAHYEDIIAAGIVASADETFKIGARGCAISCPISATVNRIGPSRLVLILASASARFPLIRSSTRWIPASTFSFANRSRISPRASQILVHSNTGSARAGLTNGLSKMMENCHVRFLGRERRQCRSLTRRRGMNSPELIRSIAGELID
jgi:hypothetical protein